MKQLFPILPLLAASLTAAPALGQAHAPVEGRWTSPKRNIVIEVAPCGQAWCGTVVAATAKAKASARKAGTRNLIGTRILSGARPIGKGVYKGRGFIPHRNITAPATIRQRGPNVMEVQGCALGGLLCKEQRWTRVG